MCHEDVAKTFLECCAEDTGTKMSAQGKMKREASGSFSTKILMGLYWPHWYPKLIDWIVISLLWRHDLKMEGNAGNSTCNAHECLRCFEGSNASSWDKTRIETVRFWLTTLSVKFCEVPWLFQAASSFATASEKHKSQGHRWHKVPKNLCRAVHPNTATAGKSCKSAMWSSHVVAFCSECCFLRQKFFTARYLIMHTGGWLRFT